MPANLFSNLPTTPLAEERFDTLLENGAITIERIVSTGQTAPDSGWFDQVQDEWVCLIEGDARLEIEGQGESTLVKGDWLHIPAGCKHKVTHTRAVPPTIWLAVHFSAVASEK